MNIVIYRKQATGPVNYNPEQFAKKPTAKQISEENRRMDLVARVKRPELVAFLADGFAKLPAIPQKVIDNRPERILSHEHDCWVIPAESLGRVAEKVATGDKTAVKSCTQSLVLWVKQNCGHLVNPEHVSIVAQ